MTLYDIGFTKEEVRSYMELLLGGETGENERMSMLNTKRRVILDEIHFKEQQLNRLDYFRYEIQLNNQHKQGGNKK